MLHRLPGKPKYNAVMLSRLEKAAKTKPSPKVKPRDVKRATEKYMQLIVGDEEKRDRRFWEHIANKGKRR